MEMAFHKGISRTTRKTGEETYNQFYIILKVVFQVVAPLRSPHLKEIGWEAESVKLVLGSVVQNLLLTLRSKFFGKFLLSARC